MSTYEVVHPESGQTLEIQGDKPPTTQELQQIFSQAFPPPPPPGPLQTAAQALETPLRGFRGLGVGAERLAADWAHKELGQPRQSLSEIAQQAADATKPNYVPKPGEKLGAMAGEMAATAPVMALTGGGSMWAQAAKGAMTAGAITAVDEAAKKGTVEPVDVAFSAAMGGAVPIIAPTLSAVARGIRGGSKVAATAGTTLQHEAVDELAANPKLLEQYKGTADSVAEKVADIQKALITQHEEAATILGAAREKIGFREPFETTLRRVQAEGFKPPDIKEILGDFKILKEGKVTFLESPESTAKFSAPKIVTSGATGSLGDQAMEYTVLGTNPIGASKVAKIPDGPRLRDLIRLRQKVDDLIAYPSVSQDVPKIGSADQAFLRNLRGKINDIIWNPNTGKGIKGGQALREADWMYSTSRELYDDFQKEMVTTGKAEDVVRKVLMGGDIKDVIGKPREYVQLLQKIEAAKKVALIQPAKSELAARSFNTMDTKGWAGLLPGMLGPRGTANMINASQATARGFDAASGAVGSPAVSSLLQSAVQQGRISGR